MLAVWIGCNITKFSDIRTIPCTNCVELNTSSLHVLNNVCVKNKCSSFDIGKVESEIP